MFTLIAPAGRIQLCVDSSLIESDEPYINMTREIIASPASAGVSIDLEMTTGSALVVMVRTTERGQRLQGLLIAKDVRSKSYRVDYNAELGCLIFVGLQPGEYQLAVLLLDEPATNTFALGALRESVKVADTPRTDLQLKLDPMGTLATAWGPRDPVTAESRPTEARIEIISIDDRPVDLWLQSGDFVAKWVQMASTSFRVPQGEARRRRLPPGRYLVRFHHDDLEASEQGITVRASEETRVYIYAQHRAK